MLNVDPVNPKSPSLWRSALKIWLLPFIRRWAIRDSASSFWAQTL